MSLDPFRKSILPYVEEIGIDDATFQEEFSKLPHDQRSIVIAERRKKKQEHEEQAWRKYWKDHYDSIKKIRGKWRRTHFPTLLRTSHDEDQDHDVDVDSDPDEWLSTALGAEVDIPRNYGRAQRMHWYRDLFFYLKEYLIQKYYPDIHESKVHAFAERLLKEGMERTGISAKEYMLEQIDKMDRKIKNDLLSWYKERGIAHMYKRNRPYENVANYVILNEYDSSDWNKILPLLGKTDVNSLSGGSSDQESKLLHVLEEMGKESSRIALTRKRSGGKRMKKPKKKLTRRR